MVRFGLAVWLATAAASTALAGEPPAAIGPQSGSDEVRAARPVGPEPALLFQLRDEEDGAPAEARMSSVTLTSTYVAVVTGDLHRVDDRALCRDFFWTDGKGGLGSLDCHAQPVIRVNELQNRRAIAGMLKAAKIDKDPALTEDYWPQAELAVTAPGETRLTVSSQGDATEFRLGDIVVARLSGTATTWDAEERTRFIRFAARHLPLHPQVRRALAASPVLPARIELRLVEAGKPKRRVLSVSAARRASVGYPLPANLASDWRATPKGDPDLTAGVARAVEAADGRTHPPEFEALVARLQDAGSHGRGLEATFDLLNIVLQYPREAGGADAKAFGDRVRPAVAAAMQDPRAARFMAVSSAAGSRDPASRRASAKWLSEQGDMDALPFGAFSYVTFANLVTGATDADKWDAAIFKAMPPTLADDYWRAIAAYPWASGFYKDLGALYLANYDAEKAWLAFDLGRAIDPEWRSGPMASVAAMEDRVRAEQPDFF